MWSSSSDGVGEVRTCSSLIQTHSDPYNISTQEYWGNIPSIMINNKDKTMFLCFRFSTIITHDSVCRCNAIIPSVPTTRGYKPRKEGTCTFWFVRPRNVYPPRSRSVDRHSSSLSTVKVRSRKVTVKLRTVPGKWWDYDMTFINSTTNLGFSDSTRPRGRPERPFNEFTLCSEVEFGDTNDDVDWIVENRLCWLVLGDGEPMSVF